MSAESHVTEPALNATPLIDVLLVLLVMLIFTLPIATHAVNVNLPQRAHDVPPPAVQLEILHGGDIFWDGKFIASQQELAPKLRALAGQENPPLLKVMPEKRARYEIVAQVLAAAQRSGVRKLTVTPVADR